MNLARTRARLKRLVPLLARVVAGVDGLRHDVDLRDVLVFGGIALTGYGIGLVYLPLAWIVCGGALFWVGITR